MFWIMFQLCLLFERQGILAKTDSRINQNHNAEYSDQMAEWIENHKAEFYHNAEYFTKLKSTKKYLFLPEYSVDLALWSLSALQFDLMFKNSALWFSIFSAIWFRHKIWVCLSVFNKNGAFQQLKFLGHLLLLMSILNFSIQKWKKPSQL